MRVDLTPGDLGIGELFDVVRDAVVVADAETGTVALWNGSAEAMFGWPAAEAVGMSLERLVPDELRLSHREGLRRYATSRRGPLITSGAVVELPALHRDGDRLWVELRLSPLERTRVPGRWVLALVRDVSLRHAERDDLAASNESLKSFLSAVAHDIRNPLMVIAAASELISGRPGDAAVERAAEMIVRQVRTIDRLAADLASAALLESGEVTPQTSRVDVLRAAEDVVEAVGAVGADVEVHGQPVFASADPDHVSRILANLVSNALKYGAEPIAVDVTAAGDRASIKVRDHGPGVPEALRPHLFNRFWRNPAHRGHPGLGLGLTIVKGLAEANGGSAWYEPDDGAGACFCVELPSYAD